MKTTAAQAIRRVCRGCYPPRDGTTCGTKVCKLSPEVFKCGSSVMRIRQHCLDCAAHDTGAERSPATVTACDGVVHRDNGNDGRCWLHPYRLGRNPDRPKRVATPAQKDRAAYARGHKGSKTADLFPDPCQGRG